MDILFISLAATAFIATTAVFVLMFVGCAVAISSMFDYQDDSHVFRKVDKVEGTEDKKAA